MNISQIRYFVTVAHLQNMTRAAELLHLSQPSLSKSIARLEEELGTPLFLRSGKRITLSKQGKRFLDAAMVMLRELDDAVEEMDELGGGMGSRLAVGVYGAHPAVMPLLAEFAGLHPEVEYELTSNIEIIEHLEVAEFDMLVYPAIPRYAKLVGRKLCDERYLLAVPASHPLAGRRAVRPADFLDEPFVFLRSGTVYTEYCCELCSAMSPGLRIRGYVTAPEFHREMVASGMALGFVPEGCADAYRRDRRIRLLTITDSRFSRSMMFCFRKEKYETPLGLQLQQFMLGRLEPGRLRQ